MLAEERPTPARRLTSLTSPTAAVSPGARTPAPPTSAGLSPETGSRSSSGKRGGLNRTRKVLDRLTATLVPLRHATRALEISLGEVRRANAKKPMPFSSSYIGPSGAEDAVEPRFRPRAKSDARKRSPAPLAGVEQRPQRAKDAVEIRQETKTEAQTSTLPSPQAVTLPVRAAKESWGWYPTPLTAQPAIG